MASSNLSGVPDKVSIAQTLLIHFPGLQPDKSKKAKRLLRKAARALAGGLKASARKDRPTVDPVAKANIKG
ncbi:MAG: hypothetical protein H0X41_08655 [Chitinophagaceae bacterium]|nr:hypothetical protein [Chitinophagaceae bacterium]